MAQSDNTFQTWTQKLGMIPAIAAAGGAVLYYLLKKSRPAITHTVSLDNQSVELEPCVRTSHYAADGKLCSFYYDNAKTCYEVFVRGIKASNNGPCLGARTGPNLEYEWLSYQEVYDRSQMLGSAFIQKGLQPGNDTFVGIFANNCPNWVIAEQTCNMYSMVSIPLYDTLGNEACSYIINQTQMEVVVCDKLNKAQRLLESNDTPSLKLLIIMDDVTPMLRSLARKAKVEIFSFNEMLDMGKQDLKDVVPPKPDDLVTICYTSGTTGNPKGVMLTHENLVANTAAMLYQVPDNAFCNQADCHMSFLPLAHMFERIMQNAITEKDCHMSFLPLAHMFEGIIQCMMFQHGARIGFFRGDVKLLTEDMQVLQPTIFPVVPRLLNRIYDKVMMGIKGSRIKSFLFNLALSRKKKMLESGIQTNTSIWDKLVFKKVQKLLGGKVRISITGSAPLAADVLAFTRCAFGCTVFEGYGQTECTAGCAATLTHESQGGNVGPPLSCNIVKLEDVPDMNYFIKDNKGEVLVKGTNVMRGYYKDTEKTKEAIDEDGWLHTGDIGQWMPNGSLKIIDRKKHIFKLAQGEYLAPEKIEGFYMRSSLVAQAFVDGNSLYTFPVAVIVPDEEVLPIWAENQGIKGSYSELCDNPTVKKAIFEDLIKMGKESGLKGFEQVKQIHIHKEMFSVENGFLTPTFKAKRPVMRKFFADIVEEMYNQTTA